MENIEIVDDFLDKNYRSPTKKEFLELGGNMVRVKREYKTYLNFLEFNGYDRPTKICKVVEVVNSRGEVIFEGSVKNVAEKYGTYRGNVRICIKNNWNYKSKYKVRYKNGSKKSNT